MGEKPEQVAILWDGRRAVSLDQGSRTLTELSLEPFERVQGIALDHAPGEVVVSPNGFAAVVLTGRFRGTGNGVVVVAGDPLRVVAQGPTGRAPYSIAINGTGSMLATADSGGGTATFFEVIARPREQTEGPDETGFDDSIDKPEDDEEDGE